jgi:glycerol-3-phosphate dehydrogenase
MDGADFGAFLTRMRLHYPWLEARLLERYARAYGTRMTQVLEGCARMADLGAAVLPGVHVREINHLRTAEFARTATDILYRRSKLGLHLPAGSTAMLDAWLSENPVAA